MALAHKAHVHPSTGPQQASRFERPEYFHVLLNPFPMYGVAAGAFFLFFSLLRKKESAPALIWLILMSLITAGAIYFGQQGYDRLYSTLDPEARQWLDVHMKRAEDFLIIFHLVGVAALASLITRHKWPRVAQSLGWVTFVLALICVGLGGWISRAGGQIRHSEFRHDSPTQLPNQVELRH